MEDSTAYCPLCKHLLDPTDVSIICKQCGHLNEHHSVFFNCDSCHADLDKVICPNCGKEFTGMLLLGSYKYKTKDIEPFNISPVDNSDAAKFMRCLTGEEEFHFGWDEKPKSMMIYELEYAFPEHCHALGLLLSVSVDLWEHVLSEGEHESMEPYLKKYVIGKITIELGGNLSAIEIKAEPLKL